MSERNFFEMRYLYPGFMFCVGVLLYSHFEVLSIVSLEGFNGIVTFLGLTPLGFLFSQFSHIVIHFYRYVTRWQRDSSQLIKEILRKEGYRTEEYDNFELLDIRDFFFHHIIWTDVKNNEKFKRARH
jgi:hypothetical protein